MYNPGNEDIELSRLSREAADSYQAPGVPDWEAMEARLDNVMPVEKKRKRFFFLWWMLPALLTAGVAGWYLKTALTNDRQQLAAATVTKPTTSPAISAKQPPAATELKENTTSEENSHTSYKGSAIPAVQPPITALPKFGRTAFTKTPIAASSNTSRADLTTDVAQITNVTPSANSHDNETAVPGAAAIATAPPAKGSAPLSEKPAATTPGQTPVVEPTTTRQENTAEAARSTVTATKKRQNESFWSFTVLGGVDKSTVKFHYDYEPGYNVGVMAGYHFNKSFSVHTGAIYTQKNYKMLGSDFTATPGTWASYYKIETVEGYCRMWEVPLEARYTVNRKGRTGFFVGAGISSYFMTSENYDYAYYSMGSLAEKNIGYNSSAKNILSIASISVGFEQRISPTLFLQVQPYAKLPMGGVGSGSYHLSSFGVNFGAQFRQMKR